MLLAVLLTGLICTLSWNNEFLQASAAEPGYLDFDNLPETNFSCESKVIGGYYADVETGCQMFHVCTIGQKGEVADIKFLCLNGTVFDQETRVCERLDEVDCSKSESYYDLNLELYGNSGATYGIQPENEEEPAVSTDDDDKCVEDEEDCKTEPLPNSKPAQPEDEYEEMEEPAPDPTPPSTSTTTTPRPRLSTSPRPAQIPYPTSSPETIAALLALHNAFQESLKEHDRPASPRPSTPSPVKSPSPPPPPRFSSPVSFSTSPRPLSFVLNSQHNFQGGNHAASLPQQPPQVTNHHFPAPQTHKQPQSQQQQSPQQQSQPQPFPFNLPKTKQPLPPLPPFTSTIRSSQAFGNSNFQQSFREEQQNIRPGDEDEEYSVEDYEQSQPSTPRPLYNAYKHNQNRFAISHQDTNPPPPPAPPSNFLLHQLKLRFNDNPPQKHPGAHGFTRAVANHDTKVLTFPEKPPPPPVSTSITTPAAVSVVLSKSSTSSVVRTVSSRNQSAISHTNPPQAFNASKYFPTSTLKPSTTTTSNLSQPLEEDYKAEEEYEDYLEEELEPDPFYKDVPKLDRQRRNIENKGNMKDVERIKKKYKTLLKMLHKKKYEDPIRQAKIRQKLLMLKEDIKAAEAEIEGSPSKETTNYEFLETTTEQEINFTFPILTPPTPPPMNKSSTTLVTLSSPLIITTTPETEVTIMSVNIDETPSTSPTTTQNPPISLNVDHYQNYAFTLFNDSHSNSAPVTSPLTTPSTAVPSKHNKTKTSKAQHFFDMINISEDLVIGQNLPRRKQVQEDYFGSITSKAEAIRDLLQRLKSRASTKTQVSINDTKDWFSNNTNDFLGGTDFSLEMCTDKDLYNEFLPSNETLEFKIPLSSPTKKLIGTRYIKLCRQCHVQGFNTTAMLIFLIETQFLLDTPLYIKLQQETQGSIRQEDLVNIIELNSKIKVVQFKSKSKTFKLLKEISTLSNPRLLVNRIVQNIVNTNQH
ncbi:hypothetical protein M8J76_004538 [Diaphorina citri]|nr:hypothetical protein M8J76_004538 [Diaphorina citri]